MHKIASGSTRRSSDIYSLVELNNDNDDDDDDDDDLGEGMDTILEKATVKQAWFYYSFCLFCFFFFESIISHLLKLAMPKKHDNLNKQNNLNLKSSTMTKMKLK